MNRQVPTWAIVLDRSPNGMASLVRMPKEPQRLREYAGRKCWLPTRWLDEGTGP